MNVVEKKPIPIYQTECQECHSKIQYRNSEVSFTSYITCPVCGMSVWAEAMLPVRYEEDEEC